MKRNLSICVAAILIVAFSVPSVAVPRLQTYIWWSQYVDDGIPDQGTWTTNRDNFVLTTTAYWRESEFDDLWEDMLPRYDAMDTYLRIGIPRGEAGSISINGTEIGSLTSPPPSSFSLLSPPASGGDGDLAYSYIRIGRMDNRYIGALHFDHGIIHDWGWGSMAFATVSVSGYSRVDFDAQGIDLRGNVYGNPLSHDARFVATPEPGTLSLLGLGLLGAAPLLRKRKR